jgi:RimJ/RimL family protein N-acetyltransferase
MEPLWIALMGGYALIVGAAQAVLFRGKKPREASVYSGIVAWVVLGLIALFLAEPRDGWFYAGAITIGSFTAAPLLGYLTGGVLAGVFLILDRIRTGQWNQVREVEAPATLPLTGPFGLRYNCPQPVLETERLRLRPFTPADAASVQHLAGDAEVAATTANLPHPYPDGMAEAWIASHAEKYRHGQEVVFAVVRKEDDHLLGAIGLRLVLDQGKGELGYWIGRPHWNQGFATEAARAVVGYGFLQLGLISVLAHHMARNPASGRVMQKIGMHHTATLREHLEKNGVREDCEQYEVERYEWGEKQETGEGGLGIRD